jgi:hypothetical protein
MAGVDLRTVAELLGNGTLQMVIRYPISLRNIRPRLVDRPVKARNQRDTKSDAGDAAAKATKRLNVASR